MSLNKLFIGSDWQPIKYLDENLSVIDVPPSGIKSWSGGAYVFAFVISKKSGNFLVKGYYSDVQDFLRNNYTHYLVKYTLWSKGKHRTIWHFWKENVQIYHVINKKGKTYIKNRFIIRDSKNNENNLDLRRPLRNWISPLNKF